MEWPWVARMRQLEGSVDEVVLVRAEEERRGPAGSGSIWYRCLSLVATMDWSSGSSTFREAMRRQRSWVGWLVGIRGDGTAGIVGTIISHCYDFCEDWKGLEI